VEVKPTVKDSFTVGQHKKAIKRLAERAKRAGKKKTWLWRLGLLGNTNKGA